MLQPRGLARLLLAFIVDQIDIREILAPCFPIAVANFLCLHGINYHFKLEFRVIRDLVLPKSPIAVQNHSNQKIRQHNRG